MPNPGSFLGRRKQFIEAQSSAYAAAVESGQINDVLTDIQRRYFKRFPPGLEHNVDPTQEWLDQVDDAAPDQDIPAPSPDLPLEEFRRESLRYDKLREEIKTRKEQIKRRLHYIYNKSRERETAFEKNSTDALSVLAAKLSGVNLIKPRKKTPANLWGPENRALVDPIFKERVEKGAIPASQHLKLRSSIYKEMFDALPQAEQAEWQGRADREHDALLKAQRDAMKAPPSTAPVDRQRVITAIPKLLEPVLDLIAEYTGWKGSLIIGGPEPADNGRLNMVSIHFGVTQGTVKMDFGRSERVVFKNHIQPAFGRFIKKCFTVDDCRAMALPADHQETTLSTLAAEEDVQVHQFDHDHHHTKSGSTKASLARPHGPPKAKENTARDASSSLHPKAAVSGIQVKYGPPKGVKAKAPRVPPVGVAKDKILGPLMKAPTPACEPSTHQQSDQDASREATHSPPPKPSTSTRSPAPTPPPSRPSSPAPTSESTQIHPPITGGTSDTSKSQQDGTRTIDVEPTAAAPGGIGAGDADQHNPGGMGEEDRYTPGRVDGGDHHTGTGGAAAPGGIGAGEADQHNPGGMGEEDRYTPGCVDGGDHHTGAGGVAMPERQDSIPESRATSPTQAPATTTAPTPPARPPGAATVPDDNALDALVAAKSKRRNGRLHGSKGAATGPKRKADDTVADNPSKKIRLDAAPAFSIDVPAGATDWVLLAINTFTSKGLGDRWEAVVVEWLKFEEVHGFSKDGGMLSCVGRPPFVAAWIKRGRKSAPREGIGALEVYEADFASWWRGLQPEERLNGKDGELTRGEANWECLRVYGTNGLLSVVGALFFWGAAVVDNPSRRQRWAVALQDVEYALQQLNSLL